MATYFIFWVIIQCYFIYFIDSIFPVLAFGSCLSWLLCHFDPHQSGLTFFIWALSFTCLFLPPSPWALANVTLVLPFTECDILCNIFSWHAVYFKIFLAMPFVEQNFSILIRPIFFFNLFIWLTITCWYTIYVPGINLCSHGIQFFIYIEFDLIILYWEFLHLCLWDILVYCFLLMSLCGLGMNF